MHRRSARPIPLLWGKPAMSEESLLRRILAGGLTSIAIRSLGLGLGFVAQVLLSRAVGISEFGAYSIAISWGMFLSVIVTFGSDTTVLKFASGYRSEGHDHSLNSLGLYSAKLILL